MHTATVASEHKDQEGMVKRRGGYYSIALEKPMLDCSHICMHDACVVVLALSNSMPSIFLQYLHHCSLSLSLEL